MMITNTSHKKIIFSVLSISVVAIVSVLTLSQTPVSAGTNDTVDGWAKSDSAGYISMNCTNEGTCGTVDYGVDIDASGNFSGYGWSSNFGWVNFGANGCSSGVKLNLSTGAVTGEAELMSATQNPGKAAGMGSCIHMSGPTYGVTVNTTTGAFGGFAWHGYDTNNDSQADAGIGWINFTGVTWNQALLPDVQIFLNNFSGTCGDNANLGWTYQDVNQASCTIKRNGNVIEGPGTYNIQTNTSRPVTNIQAGDDFALECPEANNPTNIVSDNVIATCSLAPECNDGLDNDGDTDIDAADLSCHTNCDGNSYDPNLNESHSCNNTVINTGQIPGDTGNAVPDVRED